MGKCIYVCENEPKVDGVLMSWTGNIKAYEVDQRTGNVIDEVVCAAGRYDTRGWRQSHYRGPSRDAAEAIQDALCDEHWTHYYASLSSVVSKGAPPPVPGPAPAGSVSVAEDS